MSMLEVTAKNTTKDIKNNKLLSATGYISAMRLNNEKLPVNKIKVVAITIARLLAVKIFLKNIKSFIHIITK